MNQEFYTLGSFEFVAEVQIIKGKLESEGIPVFLLNENTLNSDPLLSNAIGGIKLQVYSKHKDKALAIYDAVRTYATDVNNNPIKCPNCKAAQSELYYERKSLFHKLFPFFEQPKYRCKKCEMITKPYK